MIVDGDTPTPELILIDTGKEQPPASRWRLLGVLALAIALGGAAILTGDVGDVTPRVEFTSDGACEWSGAEVLAGLMDIEFVNNSGEAVWVKFAPMIEEATIDDVIAAAPGTGDLHDYERVPLFVGRGQNTRPVKPGTTVVFTVGLTSPGDYAVSCSTTEPTFASGVPVIASEALHAVRAG